MSYHDAPYLYLLKKILDEGVDKGDRTGTGTRSIFGAQMRFDLSQGFPLLTTKKMFLRGIIHELLWFLSGDTNVKYLQDKKVRIWNDWATKEQCAKFGRPKGELGPVYGHQWRNFGATSTLGGYLNDGVDQISEAIKLIKNNPNSRRIIVSGWNPAEATAVALPPCHTLFQFYVADGKLSCQLYQRSADVFLGVPFNIASYALLTMMMAHVCDLKPGTFVHTFGDVHIYKNHLDQVNTQLDRYSFKSPTIQINSEVKDIFEFKRKDFTLKGYKYHPVIKAPIAI